MPLVLVKKVMKETQKLSAELLAAEVIQSVHQIRAVSTKIVSIHVWSMILVLSTLSAMPLITGLNVDA